MLALISDVLDFSKIEAEKIVLNPRPLRLHKMIDDMTASIRPAADKKGLTLESHVAPELPEEIFMDGPRLRQIVLNLLTNAIKFTRRDA